MVLVNTLCKPGFSALAPHKGLGLNHWKAWKMLKKIRQVTRAGNSIYKLAGTVEHDDTFFSVCKEGRNKRE